MPVEFIVSGSIIVFALGELCPSSFKFLIPPRFRLLFETEFLVWLLTLTFVALVVEWFLMFLRNRSFIFRLTRASPSSKDSNSFGANVCILSREFGLTPASIAFYLSKSDVKVALWIREPIRCYCSADNFLMLLFVVAY